MTLHILAATLVFFTGCIASGDLGDDLEGGYAGTASGGAFISPVALSKHALDAALHPGFTMQDRCTGAISK
jgi:hypothetical protein